MNPLVTFSCLQAKSWGAVKEIMILGCFVELWSAKMSNDNPVNFLDESSSGFFLYLYWLFLYTADCFLVFDMHLFLQQIHFLLNDLLQR